jgi:hypothetical protein
MNLVVEGLEDGGRKRRRWQLMESLYGPFGDIEWRLFFDSDNPEDGEEIQKAMRVQEAWTRC